MDYEKAYKTSLKTAAQWIKDGCTDKEKICLKCVFPELRESEDERIRKWLLECVENLSDGNFIEVSRQDVLFYLEKQKEPENTSASVMAPSCWEVEQKEHKPADNMKPRVKISGRSYGEWEPGDTGVVDGYCRGANDIPYAIVILDRNSRFVMVDPEHLELIE